MALPWALPASGPYVFTARVFDLCVFAARVCGLCLFACACTARPAWENGAIPAWYSACWIFVRGGEANRPMAAVGYVGHNRKSAGCLGHSSQDNRRKSGGLWRSYFRVLLLLTILDAALQFGSHPAYSSVGNNTRGPMAQLSIPYQWSYLAFCTNLSSEINNNKSIKWLQRVGGIYHTQMFCIQGH